MMTRKLDRTPYRPAQRLSPDSQVNHSSNNRPDFFSTATAAVELLIRLHGPAEKSAVADPQNSLLGDSFYVFLFA